MYFVVLCFVCFYCVLVFCIFYSCAASYGVIKNDDERGGEGREDGKKEKGKGEEEREERGKGKGERAVSWLLEEGRHALLGWHNND